MGTAKGEDDQSAQSGEQQQEGDPEAPKRRAVLALQKFFFDEISRGGSPNGSAARALLRLNAEAAPIQDAAAEPGLENSTAAEAKGENPESSDAPTPVQQLPLRPSPAFRGPRGRNAIRVSNYT